MPAPNRRWWFDDLCFDATTAELHRGGQPVPLQQQPARLLGLLLEARGAVVPHEALRRGLWPEGTFVDFEGSLHVAVHKLRGALGDSGRRVHTIPGQGYRFVPAAAVEPAAEPGAAGPPSPRRASWTWTAAAACAAVLAAWTAASGSGRAPSRSAVAVLPLANASPAAVSQDVVDGLDETLASALAECGSLRVVSRTTMRRLPPGTTPAIARALGVDAVVEGSVVAHGDSIRVTARLIDAGSDLSVWSGRYERRAADLATRDQVARAIAQNVKYALLRPGESPPPDAAPDPWPGPGSARGR